MDDWSLDLLEKVAPGVLAEAMVADTRDHVMAAACVMLTEMADKLEAAGTDQLQVAVMRRAARGLQAETEEHRRTLDELVARSGASDDLTKLLKARRAAATETREKMKPLFKMAGRHLFLALKRAAIDEGEELLNSGKPGSLSKAVAVLEFLDVVGAGQAKAESAAEAPDAG